MAQSAQASHPVTQRTLAFFSFQFTTSKESLLTFFGDTATAETRQTVLDEIISHDSLSIKGFQKEPVETYRPPRHPLPPPPRFGGGAC